MVSFVCVFFALLAGVKCLEEIPNEGDIKVIEGVGGNFNIAVDQDDVMILTRETFNHVVMTRPLVLVEFYAPWCGHCKTLAPEFAAASKELAKDNIPLATVDATKEVELAKEYMVTGFPTMILFKGGEKLEEYNGASRAADIVEYMKQKADPNWVPPQSAVLELSAENFTSVVKPAPLILVEFYTPWCRHCQQLAPEYEAAAKVLKTFNIPLVKIDGAKEKTIADSHAVKGWPTLKIFRSGRPYEYKGARDSKGIVEYMKEQLKFPSKEVSSVLELKNNLDRLEATVVGFFDGKSDFFNEFAVAGNEMRGTFKFLHTTASDVLSHYSVEPDTVIVIQAELFHTEHEDKVYKLRKPAGSYKDIIEFINKSGTPLVGLRSKNNIGFKYQTRPLVVVYYDVNYEYQYIKDTEFIRKKIVKVAKEFTRTHPFTFAISNEDEFAEELKMAGLEDSNEDVKVVVYDRTNKFRMQPVDDFDTDDLRDFMTELLAGKHKPYFRSQPIPKKQEGPVRVIVADTFDDEIMKMQKDILLEIYAPWCGHCKALEPTYKKLAKKLSSDTLVIAKYDGEANDVPHFFGQLKGYPTIVFIPAFKKEDFVVFTGQHKYKDLKDFINENSSIFLTDEEKAGKNKVVSEEALKDEL